MPTVVSSSYYTSGYMFTNPVSGTLSPAPACTSVPGLQSLMSNGLSLYSPLTVPSSAYPLHCGGSYQSPLVAPAPSQSPIVTNPFFQPTSFSMGASSASQSTASFLPQYNPASGFCRSDVKVRKAELPLFSGLRKDWPEFKTLWPSMAEPAFQSRITLAHELRLSCEQGHANELLEDIPIVGPGSYGAMWIRLYEHYEDAAASVSAIMKTLQEMKGVKAEDYRGLTSFVKTVESCYTQLATINRLNYVSIREVDNLCSLLPVAVKEGWHERHLKLSIEEQLHPFHGFTQYLIEKRKAVSRLVETQPVTGSSVRRDNVSSYGTAESQMDSPPPRRRVRWKCAVHKDGGSGKHATEECSEFLQMSRSEKFAALRSIHACFRCFGDHPRGTCRYQKPCDSCGHSGHHTLLCHQGDSDGDG